MDIEKVIDEFDKEVVKDLGESCEPVFHDPNGIVGPVRYFLRTKLQEAYEAGQKAQDEVWKNAVPDAIDGAFDKHLKNK